jgi:hypothetical protein
VPQQEWAPDVLERIAGHLPSSATVLDSDAGRGALRRR